MIEERRKLDNEVSGTESCSPMALSVRQKMAFAASSACLKNGRIRE